MATREDVVPPPPWEIPAPPWEGPKRIGAAPQPTPTTAVSAPTPTAPQQPGVDSGAGQSFQQRFQGFGQEIVQTALETPVSLTMQGLRFGNLIHNAMMGGAPDEAVTKWSKDIEQGWGKFLTEHRTEQTKAKGAAQLIGGLLGGAVVPIPGLPEAKGAVGMMAQGAHWLGDTFVGTVGLEAMAKLPDIASAKSPEEMQNILKDIPRDIATNASIAAGFFGARAVGARYAQIKGRPVSPAETIAISKVAAEDSHIPKTLFEGAQQRAEYYDEEIGKRVSYLGKQYREGKEERLSAMEQAHRSAVADLAEATQAVQDMPEVARETRPRRMPAGGEPPSEYGEVQGLVAEAQRLRAEADRLKAARSQYKEAGPPDTGVKMEKGAKTVPTDVVGERDLLGKQLKAEQEAGRAERRAAAAKQLIGMSDEEIAARRKEALDRQARALGVEKKIRAELEYERENMPKESVAEAVDKAQTERIMAKGETLAESKPVEILDTKGRRKGFFSYFLNPPKRMPAEAQVPWGATVHQMVTETFDAQSLFHQIRDAMPDEKVRRQAARFYEGLPLDPKGPNLSQKDLAFIGGVRQRSIDAFNRAVKSGSMDEGQFVDNYVVHRFQNPEKVRKYFADRQSLKPKGSFSYERVFKDYDQAVAAGFKPITRDFADLAYISEAQYAKVNAKHQFLQQLKEIPQAMIPRKGEYKENAPSDKFVKVSDPALRGYWVEKEVAHVLDNISKPSIFDKTIDTGYHIPGFVPKVGGAEITIGARPIKQLVSKSKLLTVAIGRFHYVSTWRHALFSGYYNPGGWKTGLDLIMHGDETVRHVAEHGLGLGQTPDLSVIIARLTDDPTKIGKLISMAHTHLWREYLPGWKAFVAKNYAEHLIEKGWEPEKAYQRTADGVNNVFGIKSYEQYGRSKTFRELGQTLLFAPDWLETRLSLFANAGKQIATGQVFKPGSIEAKELLAHSVTTILLGEGVHRALWSLAGQDAPDETTRRPGEFSIPWVKDSHGRPYMFDPMLYMREPWDIVTDPIHFMKNRRSGVLATIFEEVTNHDFRDEPIRRPEATTMENAYATWNHITGHNLPIILQHLYANLDISRARINDWATAFERDVGAFFGIRSRTDFPVELRVKLESQMRNQKATKNRMLTLRAMGDDALAEKAKAEFNERGKRLESQIEDDGWRDTLGDYYRRNKRFLEIK